MNEMYSLYNFPKTGLCLRSLSEDAAQDACLRTLHHALSRVNADFRETGINVSVNSNVRAFSFDYPIPLQINYADGTFELMDVIYPKAVDGTSLKTIEDLSHELKTKTLQHIAATKTQGILISALGTKYDTRELDDKTLSIDDEGYLKLNSSRLLSHNGYYVPLKASHLFSYTIIRLLEIDEKVVLVDDYDLSSSTPNILAIDTKRLFTIAFPNHRPNLEAASLPITSDIAPDFMHEAKAYTGTYYLIKKHQESTRDDLIAKFHGLARP